MVTSDLIWLCQTRLNVQFYHKGLTPTREQMEGVVERVTGKIADTVEREQVKNTIMRKLEECNSISFLQTEAVLHGPDTSQLGWYIGNKAALSGFYWHRYRNYLTRKFTETEIAKIDAVTDKVLDNCGNPSALQGFQRRGLLLGDVQSGKTTMYTAVCNKAVDAGYKVIIVLTGIMENLRKQTQQRLDNDFIGEESFLRKANQLVRSKITGVGTSDTGGQQPDFRVISLTCVQKDFQKLSVSCEQMCQHGDAVLLVVKKNAAVLKKLLRWLGGTKAPRLPYPLLFIDDEADNASLNTRRAELDPTTINKVILSLLNRFERATYLGITATPFANLFVNHVLGLGQTASTEDLFPRDFLMLLPLSSLYIGAVRVFGEDTGDPEQDEYTGKYKDCLEVITAREMADFFPFRHKAGIADTLKSLPESLCTAVYYFCLITAICNARQDGKAHRSMLVNVSRFTRVQNKVAWLLEDFLDDLKNAVQACHARSLTNALSNRHIDRMQQIWMKYGLHAKSKLTFAQLLQLYLNDAVQRIEVRAVNQDTGPNSLDYQNEQGARIIAVGGNSLSRGLTLEGLCISYFYRNTVMYDALLQMGRWFGYRPNYDDLFKIWISEDTLSWYQYITAAYEEFKHEIKQMEKSGGTPEDFCLKIKESPDTLIVTARNKMQYSEVISVPVMISGKIIESARIFDDPAIIAANNELCLDFLQQVSSGRDKFINEVPQAYIWHDVPASMVAELVRNYRSHPWNMNYNSEGLADFISTQDFLSSWDVAVPLGSEQNTPLSLPLSDGQQLNIHTEKRSISRDETALHMLKFSSRHLRVATGSSCRIGLTQEQLQAIREQYKSCQKLNDAHFLIKERPPLLLLHAIEDKNAADNDLHLPLPVWALSLGFPGGRDDRKATYRINGAFLQSFIDPQPRFDENDEPEVDA